jgi:hypothetical protein
MILLATIIRMWTSGSNEPRGNKWAKLFGSFKERTNWRICLVLMSECQLIYIVQCILFWLHKLLLERSLNMQFFFWGSYCSIFSFQCSVLYIICVLLSLLSWPLYCIFICSWLPLLACSNFWKFEEVHMRLIVARSIHTVYFLDT